MAEPQTEKSDPSARSEPLIEFSMGGHAVVFASMLSVGTFLFKDSLHELFHAIIWSAQTHSVFVVLGGVLLVLLGLVLLLATKMLEMKKISIPFVRYRGPFLPSLIVLVGLAAGFLPVVINGMELGRIGGRGYSVALITDHSGSYVRDEFQKIVSDASRALGTKVLYTVMPTSDDFDILESNLSSVVAEGYDIVLIDDPKFETVLAKANAEKYISQFTLYVTILPRTTKLKDNKYTFVSTYPSPSALVSRTLDLAHQELKEGALFVVSDTGFGERIRLAASMFDGTQGIRPELRQDDQEGIPCSATKRSCDAALAFIDPFFNPKSVTLKFRHNDCIFISQTLGDRLRIDRGDASEMALLTYPWNDVFEYLLVSHAELGRPLDVRQTLFTGRDRLKYNKFITIGSDGSAIYTGLLGLEKEG